MRTPKPSAHKRSSGQQYAQQAQQRDASGRTGLHGPAASDHRRAFPGIRRSHDGTEAPARAVGRRQGVGVSARANQSSTRNRHHRNEEGGRIEGESRQIRRPERKEDGEGPLRQGATTSGQARRVARLRTAPRKSRTAAWDVVKSAKSRPAKDEAMAQWMKNTGWLD
jgi:hypothetical protein